MRSNLKPKYRITRKGKFVFSFLLLLLCLFLFACIYSLSHKNIDADATKGKDSIASSKQENKPLEKEIFPNEPMTPPSHKVSVYFNIKAIALSDTEKSTLNEIVDLSQEFPDAHIIVEGNTATNYPDDPNKYNVQENFKISMQRAKEVKNYLVSQGVLPELISTKSNGSTKPINDNATTGQRSKNRRADIFFQ